MSLASASVLALSLFLTACGSEADPSPPQPRQPAIDRNLPTVTEQPANVPGGITALTLTSQDKRVVSAFVLSGSSAFPGAPKEAAAAVMSNMDVPVGFAVGGPEDIARRNARRDFELLPEGVPGYVAQRSEGAHEKVSTDAAILAEVAEISTNWIDFTLYGNSLVKETLVDKPCGACAAGTWTIDSKNLDAVDTRVD